MNRHAHELFKNNKNLFRSSTVHEQFMNRHAREQFMQHFMHRVFLNNKKLLCS